MKNLVRTEPIRTGSFQDLLRGFAPEPPGFIAPDEAGEPGLAALPREVRGTETVTVSGRRTLGLLPSIALSSRRQEILYRTGWKLSENRLWFGNIFDEATREV